MRKKKQGHKIPFIVALCVFFVLVVFLIWSSLSVPEKSGSFSEQQESMQEETDTQQPELTEEDDETGSKGETVREVNEENDKEHIAGAELFPIEDEEGYIKSVTGLWLYKIHEKVETYAERYAPESTKAVCLNSAPSEENATGVLFFMELNDKKKTLIVAEFDTKSKETTVSECIWYTRKEILNEVWVTEGAPAVRDVQ